jgi:hypothetical protein
VQHRCMSRPATVRGNSAVASSPPEPWVYFSEGLQGRHERHFRHAATEEEANVLGRGFWDRSLPLLTTEPSFGMRA